VVFYTWKLPSLFYCFRYSQHPHYEHYEFPLHVVEDKEGFEHVIRYEDGIKSDFVLASCSVPVNYDYTRLNVETRTITMDQHDDNTNVGDKNNALSSDTRNEVRYFWDGGLLANTPLRQTILAYRYYWLRVRKVEGDLPKLRFCIINLHPLKQEYLPSDYDGVVDRKNDIIYHDRTEFDENVAVLMSDFITLAQGLLKLAEVSGASKEALQKILDGKTKGVGFDTRKQLRYEDLLKGKIDVDFVARLERKNDSHTISNKIFDFTKNTILQLIQDG
jgi:NTE family protein